MKKIGFIDLYLSEWHANNYPAWFKEAVAASGLDFELAYAWGEMDKSPVDGVSSAEWCEKFNVILCDTLEEVCEKSDAIVILAPSHPEVHLNYAKKVFPFGKPTYVDKPFAPDLETAKEIFALAKLYNTPFFSSSALRYAEELTPCRNISVTGGGSSPEEYLIHQAEMVVKCLGCGAGSVCCREVDGSLIFDLKYDDGRCGRMTYQAKLPFTAAMGDSESVSSVPVKSPYFKNLISDMLRFFEEKTVSFDLCQTLEVAAICEAAFSAKKTRKKDIEVIR